MTEIRGRLMATVPGNLVGGTAIQVTIDGITYTINLDLEEYGAAIGTILQRGLNGWEGLPPGDPGAVLTRGASGQPNLWSASTGVAFNNRQIFTSTGTFNKSILPTGVQRIKVEVLGAGGGGGGANTTNGNRGTGGGGGGGSIRWIDVSALAASEPVTVGTGGAAGTSSATPTNGSAGTASTFGTFCTGGGGGGGFAATGSALGGGQAGSGSGGDINIQGGAGQTNLIGTSDSASGGGQGAGTYGGAGSVNTTEIAGFLYGGGGACGNAAGAGAGANGIVVVEW